MTNNQDDSEAWMACWGALGAYRTAVLQLRQIRPLKPGDAHVGKAVRAVEEARTTLGIRFAAWRGETIPPLDDRDAAYAAARYAQSNIARIDREVRAQITKTPGRTN